MMKSKIWQETSWSVYQKLTTVLTLSMFVVLVLLKNAWITDDAYITFRTIDNFIQGHGLTWNLAERVQTFTHPLWLLVLTAAYFFTREVYFTSMVLSLGLSLASIMLLVRYYQANPWKVVMGIGLLTFSKTFVDYSTSGLENPLLYFLVGLFYTLFLNQPVNLKPYRWLSFIAGLGILTRMDSVWLFLPALIYCLWELRASYKKALWYTGIGFLPFVIWEIFSLIYYGFLFPNTAYAKLNLGVDSLRLVLHGWHYFSNSLAFDLITLVTIIVAVATSILMKDIKRVVLSVGIILYCVYILKIGGDFMSGRFLPSPFMVRVLFCWEELNQCRNY